MNNELTQLELNEVANKLHVLAMEVEKLEKVQNDIMVNSNTKFNR